MPYQVRKKRKNFSHPQPIGGNFSLATGVGNSKPRVRRHLFAGTVIVGPPMELWKSFPESSLLRKFIAESQAETGTTDNLIAWHGNMTVQCERTDKLSYAEAI